MFFVCCDNKAYVIFCFSINYTYLTSRMDLEKRVKYSLFHCFYFFITKQTSYWGEFGKYRKENLKKLYNI